MADNIPFIVFGRRLTKATHRPRASANVPRVQRPEAKRLQAAPKSVEPVHVPEAKLPTIKVVPIQPKPKQKKKEVVVVPITLPTN